MARIRVNLRSLGKKIQKLRQRQQPKMTQQDFADAMNVSLNTVQDWEQGWRYPPIDELVRIAEFFECDYDYLLGDQDQPNKEYAHISEMTGLSYTAAEYLNKLKDQLPLSQPLLVTLQEIILQTMRQEESGNDIALLPQLAYYVGTDYEKDKSGNIIDRDYMADFGALIREVERFANDSRKKRFH